MKILVAYDGSEGAHRALDQAAELAQSNGADVCVVSVAEPLPQFGRAGAMLVPEEEQERVHELANAKKRSPRKACPPRSSSARATPPR